MTKLLIIGAAATIVSAGAAFAETKTIPLLPGEYWWGGTVGGGWQMPLGEKSSYVKDLRVESDGNQAAPLLLSTKGRWVWCEDAFKYTVKNGVLTVETGPAPRKGGNTPHPMDVFAAEAKSKGEEAEFKNEPAAAIPNLEKTCYSKKEFAPIQSGRAEGGTLRAAFEYCSKTFFPPKGTPRLEFFEQPGPDGIPEDQKSMDYYQVMEYVDGAMDLSKYLASSDTTWSDRMKFASVFMFAMKTLHGDNVRIVHADLKPQNLLLIPT